MTAIWTGPRSRISPADLPRRGELWLWGGGRSDPFCGLVWCGCVLPAGCPCRSNAER